MFDTVKELLQKIRLGEDTSLELKAVVFRGEKVISPGRDELADELAALANTKGGVLVLGVEDKTRDILGIPLERLDAVERYVFEVCQDKVEPPLTFRTFRIELPDSTDEMKPVLKVEVPRGIHVHRSPGGYYHRQGSTKRQMAPDVLARLFQERSRVGLIGFDETPVPYTTPRDLDPDLWHRFVGSFPGDDMTKLQKMRIVAEDEQGQLRPTVAGVLMCSAHPERWLPNAFIQAVRYRGTSQDTNYQIDAQDISGPLDAQVDGALAFVRRNMKIAARKTPARVEIPEYSIRAVFEAVVNAVAHRDYSIYGSKIRLFMFDDRMEVFSPGGLPNTLTVESLPLRQYTRNELITTLLAKCPVAGNDQREIQRGFLMERRGDGVPIILKESTELSGREPSYRLIDNTELLLTIWAARTEKDDAEPAE